MRALAIRSYSCAYRPKHILARCSDTTSERNQPKTVVPAFVWGIRPIIKRRYETELHRRHSVLDFVLDDAQRLQRRLGQEDGRRLDDYMTSVRSVETRLEEVQNSDVQCYPDGSAPAGSPADRGEYASLMLDMLTDAMRCDLTW